MLIGVYLITLVILFFLWFLVKKTSFGLAMRASSQDIEIAEANGINARRTIDLTFVIGSAVAAIAGVLVGIYYNQVYPTMGAVPAYKSLALIVVGGLGSIQGAVFASLLLGIAETLLIGYANIPLPRDAIAFIAMISVLMWKPTGLFPTRKGA
jgi:branched-chain amino acid transport system permease protein